VQALKKIEGQLHKAKVLYYSRKKFKHTDAQAFEFNFGVNWMRKGQFEKSYEYLEQAKQQGPGSSAVYERITSNPPFFSDKSEFDDFCREMEEKTCLEIGASTEGWLSIMPWIKRRVVIDPLVLRYRDVQLKEWGKTIYTDDMKLYGQVAEITIPELVDKIDGAIICRNTLDHTTDPWKILENISAYAAEGCAFLFWADIWHFELANAGHRSIMRDPIAFENKIKEFGFDIIRRLPRNSDRSENTIDYGCVAVKRPITK
jgi:hypothetical protein